MIVTKQPRTDDDDDKDDDDTNDMINKRRRRQAMVTRLGVSSFFVFNLTDSHLITLGGNNAVGRKPDKLPPSLIFSPCGSTPWSPTPPR